MAQIFPCLIYYIEDRDHSREEVINYCNDILRTSVFSESRSYAYSAGTQYDSRYADYLGIRINPFQIPDQKYSGLEIVNFINSLYKSISWGNSHIFISKEQLHKLVTHQYQNDEALTIDTAKSDIFSVKQQPVALLNMKKQDLEYHSEVTQNESEMFIDSSNLDIDVSIHNEDIQDSQSETPLIQNFKMPLAIDYD